MMTNEEAIRHTLFLPHRKILIFGGEGGWGNSENLELID